MEVANSAIDNTKELEAIANRVLHFQHYATRRLANSVAKFPPAISVQLRSSLAGSSILIANRLRARSCWLVAAKPEDTWLNNFTFNSQVFSVYGVFGTVEESLRPINSVFDSKFDTIE